MPTKIIYKFLLSLFMVFLVIPTWATSVELKIEGMTCGACAELIKKEINKLEGVSEIQVDFQKGSAEIVMNSNKKPDNEAFKKAIETAGYKLISVTSHP